MNSSAMNARAVALLQQAEKGLAHPNNPASAEVEDIQARAAVAQGWALAAIAARTEHGVSVDVSR